MKKKYKKGKNKNKKRDKIVYEASDFQYNGKNRKGAYYMKDELINDNNILMVGRIKNPQVIKDLNDLLPPEYRCTIDIINDKGKIIDSYDIKGANTRELEKEIKKRSLWQNHETFNDASHMSFLDFIFVRGGIAQYKEENLTGGYVSLDLLPNKYPDKDKFIKGFNSFISIIEVLPQKNRELILSLIIPFFKPLILRHGIGKFASILGNIFAWGTRTTFKTGSANISNSLFRKIEDTNLASSHGGNYNTPVSLRRTTTTTTGMILVDEAEMVIDKGENEIISLIKSVYSSSMEITDISSDTKTKTINLLGVPYFTSNDPIGLFNKAEIQKRTYIFHLKEMVHIPFTVTQEMLDSHRVVGEAIAHTLHPKNFDWNNTGEINDPNMLLNHFWDCLENEYGVDCTILRNVRISKDVSEDKLLYDLIDGVIKVYGVSWESLINRCSNTNNFEQLPFIIRLKDNEFGIKKRELFNWVKFSISKNSGLSNEEILKVLGLDKFEYGLPYDINGKRVRCIHSLSKSDLISMFDELRDEQEPQTINKDNTKQLQFIKGRG